MPDPAPDTLLLDLAGVPPEGALGLLAYGYRGVEAWRAARGTAWVADRQREWEEHQHRLATAGAGADAAPDAASSEEAPPA